jgi:hypothetical protein
MASISLLRTIEVLLMLGLVMAALYAVTLWHEPACGVLLLYFAVRLALYGLLVM